MQITTETRHFVLSEIEAGQPPQEVLTALVARGMPEEAAVDFMTEVLEVRMAELRERNAASAVPPSGPAAETPQPLALDWPTVLSLPDREVQVLVSIDHPRVVLFGGLLAGDECDELVERAQQRITASEVVDLETGLPRLDAGRTSSGMSYQRGETPLVQRIEQRIAALLRWPTEHGEGLQVLRYLPGEQYRPHYDYMDPAHPGAAPFLARGGQRVASLVIYLNTPSSGGATVFPDAHLKVAAHKGNAVFFSYDRAHASTRTLHGGQPVLSGEKWIATKWLRERRHD
jgi:prolyl 4-hydroxylase